MGEKYFSLCISFDIDAFDISTFYPGCRCIQTDEKKIARQLLNDIVHLVDKYKNKGCHIVQ